jgi:glycosyltransferase involved in cell wall biosynthesis
MPNLFTVLVRPFAPRFRAVWGVRASNMDQRQYGLGASVAFWVSCRLSRFADLIICNSVSGKAFHAAHGFPPSRMVVIPNGIDVERFSPRPVAREAVRAEWGITAEQTLVGLVARLDPMKDHPTFLRAAQRVAADRPSVRFVCVGSGPAPYRAELERLATELDLGERVIWAGNRTDVAEVYNALDLLVSSSQWGEGLSNVVAEAMATGIPCVVTDVGDSRLLVGETGWLCPPADPASVASAIGAALGSAPDRARRGREARARIVDEYAVARLQEATARELSRLVDPA